MFNCIYHEKDYFDSYSFYGVVHFALCREYSIREIAGKRRE
tara:strand:- start:1100 stop:1222 length:123 start_codon:yes stop_codon:yes gene_type:complete